MKIKPCGISVFSFLHSLGNIAKVLECLIYFSFIIETKELAMRNHRIPPFLVIGALLTCAALLSVFLPPRSQRAGPVETDLAAEPSGPSAPPEAPIGIANPAAVYCDELGYQYRIAKTAQGERGECVLPGYVCDDWDFLSGKCGKEHSYCARLGYQTQVRTDGKNPFSPEYAVCVSADGRTVAAVTELIGLEQKIYKKGCKQDAASSDLSPETTLEPVFSEPSASPEPETASLPSAYTAPNAPLASFDWRNYQGGNWLTPVRNQGGCGSCWAFAAVGVAEAAHNLAAGNPNLDLDLSEQYLVSDCLSYSNCCGGFTGQALIFLRTNGVPDEACLPYVDGSGCSCGSNGCSSGCTYNANGACSDRQCTDRCSDWANRLKYLSASGYVGSDPATIQQALVDKGPLTASMLISCSGCGFDSNSVYRCGGLTGVNHAVILVGYDDAGGYWIVRNSWGSGWGPEHSGYFKLGYGECSIESYVNYVQAPSGGTRTPTPTSNHTPTNTPNHTSTRPPTATPVASSTPTYTPTTPSVPTRTFTPVPTATQNPGGMCSPVKSLSCGSRENGSNAGPGSTRKIHTYACSPRLESGPEMVYEFIPSISGIASLELDGINANLDLFVLNNQCHSGNCIANGDQAAIFPITAGQTYYVIVDGFMGAQSNYSLSVDCLELTNSVYIPISSR